MSFRREEKSDVISRNLMSFRLKEKSDVISTQGEI
jgi:hypothetical protein